MIVFDLGMNVGENTRYYLQKGYSVIAVEANPVLCMKARNTFKEEDVVIINAAVCSKERPFYINQTNSHWSSLDREMASRDSIPVKITVPCIRISDLFNIYGVPYYLKMDIEGADKEVLEEIENGLRFPKFMSIEDCRFGLEYLATMKRCGYQKFQIVDQVESPLLFGDDLEWMDYSSVVDHYETTVRNNGVRIAPTQRWFDIHCTDRTDHVG